MLHHKTIIAKEYYWSTTKILISVIPTLHNIFLRRGNFLNKCVKILLEPFHVQSAIWNVHFVHALLWSTDLGNILFINITYYLFNSTLGYVLYVVFKITEFLRKLNSGGNISDTTQISIFSVYFMHACSVIYLHNGLVNGESSMTDILLCTLISIWTGWQWSWNPQNMKPHISEVILSTRQCLLSIVT